MKFFLTSLGTLMIALGVVKLAVALIVKMREKKNV